MYSRLITPALEVHERQVKNPIELVCEKTVAADRVTNHWSRLFSAFLTRTGGNTGKTKNLTRNV